jgi:hypothetical protein
VSSATAIRRERERGKCLDCGTPTHRLRHKRCRRCYQRISLRILSTPLRRWRDRTNGSFRALAVETTISYRQIMRIAAGQQKPSADDALALNKATKIPLEELLRNGS